MILSLVIPVSQIHAYGQSFSPDSGPLDCRTDIEGFVFESATYQKTGITDVVSCIYDKGVVGVYYGPLGSERSCDDLQTTISAQVNAPGNEDFNELTSNTHWAFSIFVPVGLSGVADDLVWQVENKNLAFVCSTDKKVEEEVNPFEDTAISFVTTRGHTEEFAFADPRIVSGQSVTGYGTSGNIPGFEEGKCPSEVVIYVHGFQNSHADALVNLDDLQNSLGKNDYEIPIIGFSWDSDTGPLDFADAGLIAKLNGPKLAAFIKDYKSSCSNTKIRLMSHSLGAQVVLSTLESLHDDTKWNSCGYGKDKITSVHVLGAAVPNTSISKQSNQYGNAIESEVGIFHNKFNNEDNVLSIAYAVAGSGQALGEEGAATVTNKPSNYHQQDVTREVGNDHSGYNKESTAYNSNDPEKDGVIDDVVRDWKNQRYSTHPSCNYVDTSPTPGNSAGTDGSFGGISDQLGGIGEQVGGISDQLGGIGEQVEEISDIAKNIPVEDIKDKANEAIKQIPSSGGGCLIATATYGSELAPQVQQLRELRDNSLLQTESGTSFMNTFNDFYYSFSPHIADYERENPLFKETVKIAITPMISSLSILNYVNMNSEESVLGYGISLIVLNLAMYVGIPAVVIIGIKKKF